MNTTCTLPRDLLLFRQLLIERLEKKRVQRALSEAKNCIAHLHHANQALIDLAERDALTGCLNRRGAATALGRLTTLCNRDHLPLTLVLLDLDEFKQLNDQWGHPAGDKVLIRLVHCFQRTSRPNDIISRWGGEEFLLLLPGLNPTGAVPVMERLRGVFECTTHDGPWATFSAGLAQAGNGVSFDSALSMADTALYAAKRAGRRQVAVG